MASRRTLLSISSAIILSSCSRWVDASGFAKACEADLDCVPIYVGDMCENCREANASISAADLPKYGQLASSIRLSCTITYGGDCAHRNVEPRCVANVCSFAEVLPGGDAGL